VHGSKHFDGAVQTHAYARLLLAGRLAAASEGSPQKARRMVFGFGSSRSTANSAFSRHDAAHHDVQSQIVVFARW
jgi:hypothetical protein